MRCTLPEMQKSLPGAGNGALRGRPSIRIPSVLPRWSRATEIRGEEGLALTFSALWPRLLLAAAVSLALPGLASSAQPQVRYLGSVAQGQGAQRGLEGSQSGALSPDGRFLYTAGPGSKGVGIFEVGAGGRLRQVGLYPSDGPQGEFRGAIGLAASPGGEHLYVLSHRGRLATFRRDLEEGTLTLEEILRGDPGGLPELEDAADFLLSGDGAWVYVGSQKHGIALLSRDPGSGRLSWVETYRREPAVGGEETPLAGLMDLAWARGERELLVAGGRRGWVARLSRDPTTGELSSLQRLQGNTGEIPFLGTVTAVAASRDGGLVFAAGESPDGITVFKGKGGEPLAFHSRLSSEEVGALVLPFSLNPGPSGAFLYATGSSSTSSLVVLAGGASLRPVQVLRADRFGSGMAPVRWIFSGDGRFAYGVLDGVVLGRRDPGTGELEPIERYRDGGGVRGLARASAVAATADGRHVYTAGDWGEIGIFAAARGGVPARYLGSVTVDGMEGVVGLEASPDGVSVTAVDRAGVAHTLTRDPETGDLGEHRIEAGAAPGAGRSLEGSPGTPGGEGPVYEARVSEGRLFLRRRPQPGAREAPKGSSPSSSSAAPDDAGSSFPVSLPRGFEAGATRLARSADGRLLVLAVEDLGATPPGPGAALAFFRVEGPSGRLLQIPVAPAGRGVAPVAAPISDLAVRPDGRYVYGTARGSNGLSTFGVEGL